MGLFGIHPFTYAPNKTTFDAPANEYVFWIDREKHGRCATCGLQTHEIKQGLFYIGSVLVPLTNEHVESGRCLACKPLSAAGSSFLGRPGVAPNNLSDGGLIFDPDESVKSSDISPTHQDNIGMGIHDSAAVNAHMASSINQSAKSTGQSGKIIAGLSTLIVIAVGIALYVALKPIPLRPDPDDLTTTITSSTTPQVMPNHSNLFDDVTPNSTTLNIFDDVTSTPTTPISNTSSRELPRETQVKAELEANVLRRGLSFDELDAADSRTSALDWLLHEDGMELQATSFNLGQRYILALLSFEFGAMFRSNNVDWLSSSMECSWDWVTCNDQSEATKLELASENITGTLPPEISGLRSLEVLSVWGNSLVRSIPPELGELEELTELYLHTNSFVGTLPSEIGELKELTALSTYSNKLSGSIPSSIGELSELETLWLNHNKFIGTIPSWIGELKSLEKVYLNANQFTGSLPTALGNLVELTELGLSYNQLSSTLPSELGMLIYLTTLWLNDNQFTGTIPSLMGELTSLEELSLENNQFEGVIPSTIEELAELATEVTQPRETQVKDKLKANVLRRGVKFVELDPNDSRTSALDWLLHEDGMELQATSSNLGQRYILALLAFEFGDLFRSNNVDWLSSSMECSWDWVTCNGELKVTKLELGTLTSEISGLGSLEYLSISDNALFGTLRPEIGELTGLTALYLWGNKLSEVIPTNIGDLINLQDLSLCKNAFTSTLPTELGALTELTEVRLFSNAFTGTIPSDFGDLTSLTLLSLSYNQLSGTIPSWIGEFKQLKELYLHTNQFTEPLPTELGQLTKLTQLWLNNNQLAGKLPVELSNLEELNLLWIQNNQFTGAFEIDTSNLKDLCLDNNMFTGDLPSDIESDYTC